MTPHLNWLNDYKEFTTKRNIHLGDDRIIHSYGSGFVVTDNCIIQEVHYVPEIGLNLFSVAKCTKEKNVVALCTDKSIHFMRGEQELFEGKLHSNGIYILELNVKLAANVAMLATSLDDWHERLGHVSKQTIRYMAENNVVKGLVISKDSELTCC